MKWFVPVTAAGAAALVVSLSLALAGMSAPTRGDDALSRPPRLCIGEPSWFTQIHKSYDCNPKITPDFNFAALYSPVLPRKTIRELAALIDRRTHARYVLEPVVPEEARLGTMPAGTQSSVARR